MKENQIYEHHNLFLSQIIGMCIIKPEVLLLSISKIQLVMAVY